MVSVINVVRVVGVVRMVTLLAEHYFVQRSVDWWSLLSDVFILSPQHQQHESLVNRLTYGCKPVKKTQGDLIDIR